MGTVLCIYLQFISGIPEQPMLIVPVFTQRSIMARHEYVQHVWFPYLMVLTYVRFWTNSTIQDNSKLWDNWNVKCDWRKYYHLLNLKSISNSLRELLPRQTDASKQTWNDLKLICLTYMWGLRSFLPGVINFVCGNWYMPSSHKEKV